MRLAGRLFIAAVLLSSNAACQHETVSPTQTPDSVEVDLTAAIARASKEGRPVFVHFTAEWCLPCKALKETVYPAPVVASRLERFVRAEVDIESSEGEKFARRYRVQTVPVLMTMNPQGEELRSLRVVGMRTPSQLAVILDTALEQSGLDRIAPHPQRGTRRLHGTDAVFATPRNQRCGIARERLTVHGIGGDPPSVRSTFGVARAGSVRVG